MNKRDTVIFKIHIKFMENILLASFSCSYLKVVSSQLRIFPLSSFTDEQMHSVTEIVA